MFLVKHYFVVKGAFDEIVIVFDIGEDGTRLVALANGDLDIAYFADFYQKVEFFFGMEGEGVQMIEGQKHDLLVVDAH